MPRHNAATLMIQVNQWVANGHYDVPPSGADVAWRTEAPGLFASEPVVISEASGQATVTAMVGAIDAWQGPHAPPRWVPRIDGSCLVAQRSGRHEVSWSILLASGSQATLRDAVHATLQAQGFVKADATALRLITGLDIAPKYRHPEHGIVQVVQLPFSVGAAMVTILANETPTSV